LRQSAGREVGPAAGNAQPTAERYAARGTVKAVDREGRVINLAHEPVEELGWPSMTMDFGVAAEVDLEAIEPGQGIHFTMRKGADGRYVIDGIELQPAAPLSEAHDHD
jgi:Cu(I)/Ag(I) efflux system membrane fusion protein